MAIVQAGRQPAQSKLRVLLAGQRGAFTINVCRRVSILIGFAAFFRALCLPEGHLHRVEMDEFPESWAKVCNAWAPLLFWKKCCRNLPWLGRLWRPRSVPLLRFLCLSWAPSETRANPCQTLLWKRKKFGWGSECTESNYITSRPSTVFSSFKAVSHMKSALSIASCCSSESDDWSEAT